MPSAAGTSAQVLLASAVTAAAAVLTSARSAHQAAPTATTAADLVLARGVLNATRRARAAALELT